MSSACFPENILFNFGRTPYWNCPIPEGETGTPNHGEYSDESSGANTKVQEVSSSIGEEEKFKNPDERDFVQSCKTNFSLLRSNKWALMHTEPFNPLQTLSCDRNVSEHGIISCPVDRKLASLS